MVIVGCQGPVLHWVGDVGPTFLDASLIASGWFQTPAVLSHW